jgi:hypothetical protein
MAGLFGYARLPGGAEVFCEGAAFLEESQFRDLFEPFVKSNPLQAPEQPLAKNAYSLE